MAAVGMAVFCYAIVVANLKVWVFSFTYTWVLFGYILNSST